MLYAKSITIPKSTASTAPTAVRLPISAGVITKIMVRPRSGHRNLAHCVIRWSEHQIAPSTEGMDFHGDYFPIDWEEDMEIDQPPFELKIEGWNDDDTYQHIFDVYVAMLPRSATLAGAFLEAVRILWGMLSPRRIFGGGG